MYKYETHAHTSPVSRCAVASVEETLQFYKKSGYDGVFITNHFLNGNINIPGEKPYEEKINFYFSDYEKGLELSEKIGIKVFCGVEFTYYGTDFLIYGLDKQWYLDHPEIMSMKINDVLNFMMESGALVIQAHPYREASYIDNIRLFPRNVHGVEIINASQPDFQNYLAKVYTETYDLPKTAGSDNHCASQMKKLAGICCEEPICSIEDFIDKVKNRKTDVFTLKNEL